MIATSIRPSEGATCAKALLCRRGSRELRRALVAIRLPPMAVCDRLPTPDLVWHLFRVASLEDDEWRPCARACGDRGTAHQGSLPRGVEAQKRAPCVIR